MKHKEENPHKDIFETIRINKINDILKNHLIRVKMISKNSTIKILKEKRLKDNRSNFFIEIEQPNGLTWTMYIFGIKII